MQYGNIKKLSLLIACFALIFSTSALAKLTAAPQVKVRSGLTHTTPCLNPDRLPNQAKVPCVGIVAFKPGVTRAQRADVVKKHGAKLRFNYQSLEAAAVLVEDEATLAKLMQDNQVVAIVPDRPITAIAKPDHAGTGNGKKKNNDSNQTVPAGVAHIGAAPGALSVTGAGVGVAIVDSGLAMNHPDLAVSSDCYTVYSSCEDGSGHGTHVGGIVAALDNELGVVGVAPDATLYAVKALDDNGNGSDATVIAGLDWIINNANQVNPAIKVVNMSLGRPGSLDDDPILREMIRVVKEDMGIAVVVAAGNVGSSEVFLQVPATYPEVIAVASTTANDGDNRRCRQYSGIIPQDTASFFSTDGAFDINTGMGVTISAPGEKQENINRSCFISTQGILSLSPDGSSLVRQSGTSMATPHVAGTIALMVEGAGGVLDPELARDRLRAGASNVGQTPLDSPTVGYSFDGERERVLSACGALNEAC